MQGAAIDSWGVGTNLITSKDCPSFGGVYKLAAIQNEEGEFVPKIKISENTEKITNPGNKTIYRIYEKESGKIKADLICFADEVIDTEQDLLLFDPIETWKKTETFRWHLYSTRDSCTCLQKRRMHLQISDIKRDCLILLHGKRHFMG